MPPESPGQQATQVPGQQAGAPASAQPGTAQEPKWLSAIPDPALREEAKKDYLLQADYTKKTQTFADQQRAWEQEKTGLQERARQYDAMSQWYQTQYLPFHQRISPKWETIDRYLKGEIDLGGNGAQAAAAQVGGDAFKDWDLLPGNEQAKRLTEHLKTSYFDPTIQRQNQEWQQFYAAKEREWAGFIQRYNAIYADAFQKALTEYRQGREFPIQDYVNAQLEISAGKIDVPGLAFQKVTGDHRQKELEKEWYERGKKDREQELLNQQQSPGALQNSSVPIFRQAPKTRDEVSAAARKVAAEKGIPWI